MTEQRRDGWRVSEPYSESKQAKFVKQMYDECMAEGHPPPKVIPTFKSPEEKEAFIFAMQQPSTREAIIRQKTRAKEEDLDYLLRPMPNCIANPEAKDRDELVGERRLYPGEVINYEKMRMSQKNTRGESKLSSVDNAKREKGIHAMTYSKPYDATLEEIKRLKKLEPMEAILPEFAPKERRERAWWKLDFLKGIAWWDDEE